MPQLSGCDCQGEVGKFVFVKSTDGPEVPTDEQSLGQTDELVQGKQSDEATVPMGSKQMVCLSCCWG